MPKWLAEGEVMRAAANQRRDGAPELDRSQYTAWREEAQPENVELLDFYGVHLMGRYAGFGNALDNTQMVAAFDLEGVPPEARPGLAQRLNRLHGEVVMRLPKKDK